MKIDNNSKSQTERWWLWGGAELRGEKEEVFIQVQVRGVGYGGGGGTGVHALEFMHVYGLKG